MKKVQLFASAVVASAIGLGVAYAVNSEKLPERDVALIVEVNRSLDGLDQDQALESQRAVYRNIKNLATRNVRFEKSYSVLNNAFVIRANSDDVEAIKAVTGVKSVTIDSIHWKEVVNNDSTYSITKAVDNEFDENENISATTMNKPADTNDGEGTVIAILDNEFYFRAENTDGVDAFKHEVYTDLDEEVAVRFTYSNLSSTISIGEDGNKKTHAFRSLNAEEGKEGSLYLNRKVPFYYDYGGTSPTYGNHGVADFDVSSKISYHGSHVSSIAAANGPYKGIAPKAQLACMKVFTEYKATETGKGLGFGDSSGAYDTVILSALEDCIALGVDGINMSLGSDLDDFDGESITLKTLTRLSETGILSSISAGNSGKASYSFAGAYGNWTSDMVETGILSSYANNKSVMTIASGQPDRIFYETGLKIGNENIAYDNQIVNREGLDAEYTKEFRLEDIGMDNVPWVYIPGFGAQSDYSGIDAAGKVAVVNRGSTSFASKYSVAVDNEAIGMIIINNDPTASDFNFRCSFGDDFNPTIPCALVLFKDKPIFENAKSGTFDFITKEVSDNAYARTISSYSSDGATFDYDLKPDITAPGENIKGAVPPQKKEDKEETPLSTYQYLSGTSMSAPNYAGAQSVLLSKLAKGYYSNPNSTSKDKADLDDFRKTVDMRFMSTADPMIDRDLDPETKDVKSYTSPRLAGAGMVDLGGAYNTDVYLEGMNAANEGLGKSKIVLRNEENIANGKLNLAFLAHNESEENKQYNVKLTVMRPAIASNNSLIPNDYNYRGEIDNIDKLPGVTYYDPAEGKVVTTSGSAAYKDVFKVTKQIEYYLTEEDYNAKTNAQILPVDRYYNSTVSGKPTWESLPNIEYQSVQDHIIYQGLTGQVVTVEPGDSVISISQYTIPLEERARILKFFEYGCAIEGYVELISTANEGIDLSIPYLGFYSGSDINEGASYESAPVVEPFTFEKEVGKVYPSDLVNDIAKSLVGKDNANFGSMLVAGYVDQVQNLDTEKVLTNDLAFDGITGFHQLGVDPFTGEALEDAANNLYLGDPRTSNTLIIQQFVMRSVANNYFTITNKATGEVACSSVLEDMLYGEQMGKYELYKSHVDAGFLSAGYIAHRAYAVVPLYNELTGEVFADGEYELTFNYLLSATNTWVQKSYTLHIDSTAPEISSVNVYTANGVERVRIDIKDTSLSNASLGFGIVDFQYDENTKTYYIDETREFIEGCMEELGPTEDGQLRLFVEAQNLAGGTIKGVIHFNENRFSTYHYIQSIELEIDNDFIVKADGSLEFVAVDFFDGSVTSVTLTERLIYRTNDNGQEPTPTPSTPVVPTPSPSEPTPSTPVVPTPTPSPESKGGCGGSVIAMSSILAIASTLGASLLVFKKRRK